jgi:hypothetical protein
VTKRLALSSAFDQRDLSVSSLFMLEILPLLEANYEVVKFSEEPEFNPIHNLYSIDSVSPFDYSLTFNEDRKGGIYYRFASLALPGVLLLADANFDRLFFDSPWQFKDLSIEPLLKQIVEHSTSVAVLNEHALSNVKSLGLNKDNSLFGISLPCRKRTLGEQNLIDEQQTSPLFVIGYAARYLNEEKAHEVVEILLELKRSQMPIKLLWLTRKSELQDICRFLKIEAERHLIDLESLVELQLVQSFKEERQALCRTNVFLSLRKDFLHSPPTSFYHALALGIPTVAMELGPVMGISKSSALWVPTGAGESRGLLEAIKAVYGNKELTGALSKESRAYTDLVHNPDLVASDLIQILEFNRKTNPNAMNQARVRQRELMAQI